MRNRRSSISSSESVPNAAYSRDWCLSIGTALVLVFAAELAARVLLGPGLGPGDYWSIAAGEKYEWYRAQEVPPDVLIIGDSTAARNFAPLAIEETIGEGTVFNLGTPGNFPLALEDSTFALLRGMTPPVIVLSQFTGSYYDSRNVERIELGIRDSRAIRVFNDRMSAADHVALARLYDNRRYVLTRLRDRPARREVPPGKGFEPNLQTAEDVAARESRRQAADLIVAEHPAGERLQTVLTLAQLAAEKGAKLIVALPVQLDAGSQAMLERHRNWLHERSGETGFAVLDMRTVAPLAHEHFVDILHLSPAGAAHQSRALGTLLRQCLPLPAWRDCLSDREAYPVDLVASPDWQP